MSKVYFIGGSPCSGKSTIAEIIAKECNLYYFKVDDFLDNYTELGKEKGYKICTSASKMSPEETWMRDPAVQCEEELQIYSEMIEFIMDDIEKISSDKDILAEGAAFLPELMKEKNIDSNHYISLVTDENSNVDERVKTVCRQFHLDK